MTVVNRSSIARYNRESYAALNIYYAGYLLISWLTFRSQSEDHVLF